MSGFFKDDLTVALDEVDRAAGRTITIYRDLAALTGDASLARRLREAADRLAAALRRFNAARRVHHQIPEEEEPERAHLQALWVTAKSAVTGGAGEAGTRESLRPLQDELGRAVAAARALEPDGDIAAAMVALPESAGLD